MAQSISILGLTVWKYGLFAAAGAALYLALACATFRGLPRKACWFGPLAVVLGLLCARAVFGLVNLSYFTETVEQPDKLLCFWDGGLSMTGLLLGLALAACVTAKLCGVRVGRLLDAAFAPAGLLIALLRLGEGFTALGVGRYVDAGALTGSVLFVESSLGNATLYSLAVYRYEAVAALLLLAVTLAFRAQSARPGDTALLFLAMYGASQLVLESLRDDGHMLWGFVRAQQVFAALLPLLALGVWGGRRRRARGARWQTTLAWLLLPVAALLVLLVVRPINHVLDLSGKPLLGYGGAALCAVWMAFFLRVRRCDLRLTLAWLAALLALAGCLLLEFRIDGSDNLVRDYLLMALCAALLLAAPLSVWREDKAINASR